MSQEFAIIVERDPESGWLVGSAAELPGCYTQAPDIAELQSDLGEAIEVCLETMDEEAAQSPFRY